MKDSQNKIYNGLIFIEALIVGSELYSRKIPQGGFLHSGYRLLDVVFLLAITIIILVAASLLFTDRFKSLIERQISKILDNDKFLAGILILSLLLTYEAFQDILFLQANIEAIHYMGYRSFLTDNFSLLVLLLIGSLELFFFVGYSRWATIRSWIERGKQGRNTYLYILVATLIFGALLLGLGETLDMSTYGGFNQLPAPLLGIQVLLISFGFLIVFWILSKLVKNWTRSEIIKHDWIIMLFIGILAFFLWSSVPLGASSFTDVPRPPNFDFYPTSDAIFYEQAAQQVLVGNGLTTWSSHFAFQVYLGFLHWIAGNGYRDILPFHLAILSLIPMLLYLITCKLHTRISGVVVSLLYVITARNGLMLREHITLSAFSDLMTEPFATLGVVLFSTFLIIWFLEPRKHPLMPLLAGAAIGWAIMIRVEMLVMIPAIVLIIFVYFRKSFRTWLPGILLFLSGVVFLIGPWTVYQIYETGSPLVIFQNKEILLDDKSLANGSDSLDVQQIKSVDLSTLFPHHMASNLLQLVYYLPSNHQPFLTAASVPDLFIDKSIDMEGDGFSEKYLERYVRSLPYWWQGEWNGHLVPRSYLPVLGTIFILVVGFQQIGGRKRWLAILLCLLVLSHLAAFEAIGKSGGRGIKMIDWIPMVFYGIGLSSLLGYILDWIGIGKVSDWWFGVNSEFDNKIYPPFEFNRKFFYVSSLLLVLGFSFQLADKGIPAQYTQEKLEEKLDQISYLNEEYLPGELDLRSENPEIVILYGRTIYPRFFRAEERMDDDRGHSIPDFSFSRTEFYLVGTENTWVALPSLAGEEPIPHGVDVIVIGTRQGGTYDEEGIQISGDYIKTQEIFILGYEGSDQELLNVSCSVPVDCE